jgi:hypothetical protein
MGEGQQEGEGEGRGEGRGEGKGRGARGGAGGLGRGEGQGGWGPRGRTWGSGGLGVGFRAFEANVAACRNGRPFVARAVAALACSFGAEVRARDEVDSVPDAAVGLPR